jgi:hypothetical protein
MKYRALTSSPAERVRGYGINGLKRRPRQPCAKSIILLHNCRAHSSRPEHGEAGRCNEMGKGDDRTASAMRPLASVFMHADATDAVLMALGLLGDGLSTPVMLFITSRIFNDLGGGPDLLTEFSTRIDEVE